MAPFPSRTIQPEERDAQMFIERVREVAQHLTGRSPVSDLAGRVREYAPEAAAHLDDAIRTYRQRVMEQQMELESAIRVAGAAMTQYREEVP